jgi:hypothetical protein
MDKVFGFMRSAAARGRALAAVVIAAAAFATMPGGTPASASGNQWHALGSASWRSSPSWNSPSWGGFWNGETLYLGCYLYGGPVGPYGNTLWYFVPDTGGWINDHYLDTPGTAAQPQPQTYECGAPGDDSVQADRDFHALGSTNWRSSPNWKFPTWNGFWYGETVHLGCYVYGGPAGPYGNTLWYYVPDAGAWINDHYLDTPGTAANPQPQTQLCWWW